MDANAHSYIATHIGTKTEQNVRIKLGRKALVQTRFIQAPPDMNDLLTSCRKRRRTTNMLSDSSSPCWIRRSKFIHLNILPPIQAQFKPKKVRVTTQNILTESRSKLKVVIVLKREEDDVEDIEGDAAASIRIMSTALLSAAQCSICQDILEDASSLSTCGHTFCKDCIHNTVATGKTSCCPTCKVFAWARDVMPSRRVETLLALTSE